MGARAAADDPHGGRGAAAVLGLAVAARGGGTMERVVGRKDAELVISGDLNLCANFADWSRTVDGTALAGRARDLVAGGGRDARAARFGCS